MINLILLIALIVMSVVLLWTLKRLSLILEAVKLLLEGKAVTNLKYADTPYDERIYHLYQIFKELD